MEVDKYNLEGGIRAMRQAALWLTQWADDLEKADRAGRLVNAAGPPDRLEVDASSDSEPAPATEPKTAAATASEPKPAAAASEPNIAPAQVTSSAQAAEPAPPSFDRIMEVMTALCAAELSNQVHSLILSYGASCLSEVPKEKYGDLLAAAYRLAEEGKVAMPAGDGNG